MSDPVGIWALGNFPRVSRETIGTTGPLLVAACGVGPGQRVLDVGAGAGNVAIPAAQTGATVVASDITPELLRAGRAIADEASVTLDWVHADAQALPFADNAFDVVTSAFGVMFAPDHAAAAGELLRVCAPGGMIGLLNWTPGGWAGEFFREVAAFLPPQAPGFQPPSLWGDEGHVRELLGVPDVSLELERQVVVIDHFASPGEFIGFYRANFGPVIAAFASIADDPARAAALEQALLDFARRTNLAPAGSGARYELEYLLVRARLAFGG
ncbi:MAG TPA: methyltransferase domain-containing protein [Conexibacter sp.]